MSCPAPNKTNPHTTEAELRMRRKAILEEIDLLQKEAGNIELNLKPLLKIQDEIDDLLNLLTESDSIAAALTILSKVQALLTEATAIDPNIIYEHYISGELSLRDANGNYVEDEDFYPQD